MDDGLDLTIITGLSGAGKSQAANILEDLGFFVIDNLPVSLLAKMVDLASEAETPRRHAVVVDFRSGAFTADLTPALAELRRRGTRTRIVFFDAGDDVLIRRFGGTRRPHPLSEGDTLSVGIARERSRLEAIRGEADVVIDTSEYSLPDLRSHLRALFTEAADAPLQVNVISFGYKHGLPLDADVVLDCRFLPNPHWIEALRPQTGEDTEVRAFVLDQVDARPFLGDVERMLATLLPAYAREGKSYLTLGVGCTGGRHRSVVMAGEIARALQHLGYTPIVNHRDIDRD